MMRRLPILSAVLAPLGCALLGCDGGPSSVLIDVRVENPYQFLRWAQLQGPMLVEIHGQPFAGTARFQPAEFVAAVKDTFAEQPGFRFTLDKAEAGDSGYRFVWLFDPGPGFSIDATCAGQLPAAAPKLADRAELRAVFCGPNKTYTAVQGSTKRPTETGDRNWRRLIRQMSRQLVGDRLTG